MNAAAQLAVAFSAYLRDPATGVYFHGYNAATGETSCCLWGRASAWAAVAQVEVLTALEAVAPSHPLFPKLRAQFIALCTSLVALQNGDGAWHQILNDTTTFAETSVTAAALYALTSGVMAGWLMPDAYASTIEAAWDALASLVGSDGHIAGVSPDTPILTTAAEYAGLPVAWATAQPGVGVFLMAARAYYLYSAPPSG